MGSASAFVIRWINFFTMVSQSPRPTSILPCSPSPFSNRRRRFPSARPCLRLIIDSWCPAFARHFFIEKKKLPGYFFMLGVNWQAFRIHSLFSSSFKFIISIANWGF